MHTHTHTQLHALFYVYSANPKPNPNPVVYKCISAFARAEIRMSERTLYNVTLQI